MADQAQQAEQAGQETRYILNYMDACHIPTDADEDFFPEFAPVMCEVFSSHAAATSRFTELIAGGSTAGEQADLYTQLRMAGKTWQTVEHIHIDAGMEPGTFLFSDPHLFEFRED